MNLNDNITNDDIRARDHNCDSDINIVKRLILKPFDPDGGCVINSLSWLILLLSIILFIYLMRDNSLNNNEKIIIKNVSFNGAIGVKLLRTDEIQGELAVRVDTNEVIRLNCIINSTEFGFSTHTFDNTIFKDTDHNFIFQLEYMSNIEEVMVSDCSNDWNWDSMTGTTLNSTHLYLVTEENPVYDSGMIADFSMNDSVCWVYDDYPFGMTNPRFMGRISRYGDKVRSEVGGYYGHFTCYKIVGCQRVQTSLKVTRKVIEVRMLVSEGFSNKCPVEFVSVEYSLDMDNQMSRKRQTIDGLLFSEFVYYVDKVLKNNGSVSKEPVSLSCSSKQTKSRSEISESWVVKVITTASKSSFEIINDSIGPPLLLLGFLSLIGKINELKKYYDIKTVELK